MPSVVGFFKGSILATSVVQILYLKLLFLYTLMLIRGLIVSSLSFQDGHEISFYRSLLELLVIIFSREYIIRNALLSFDS